MKDRIPFAVNNITCVILLSLFCNAASAVEFNTDVLDAADKKNIDFTRFSEAGYVLPGQYLLDVIVNGQSISPASLQISFVEPALSGDKAEKKLPQACLTSDMVRLMGLTAESLDKVVYWHDGQCADFHGLPGVDIRPDTGAGVLRINMPQAWLEYSDATWLPPSRWDDGIPGLMLDYNLNGTVSRNYQGGDSHQFSYNGTVGGNLGPWRLRADYQGSQEQSRYNGEKTTNRNFTWSRFYLFRAIPRWRANLTLGENNINSDIFRSWSYTGASLESDDRMLPPRLRGYAPQITGIAETNARVVVSQQGRVLYDSMVPAGPFSIQDLDSSVRGRLDVEVIEQNGRKKTFQVDTASVPYLTRPGQVRYKLVSGRSRGYGHETEGPVFATGEASWGLSNQWSLKAGQSVVQLWHKGQCVAQHPRSTHEYKHTTNPLHMPERHRQHGTWTPERLIEQGKRTGPSTGRVVESMLKAKPHPELAYRAVLGLLALQKKYGPERLEKACYVALHYNAPDRRFIDNLLRHHRENLELPLSRQGEQHPAYASEHENLRGPGYYH
ncbi:fimbria/pilus outer membrane usher protein [Escherichia coli]|uniref:fimbria/pilus outer membrane usher protein n=1 Tax=Escherichia coli TaxID=562 RepID=UPI00338E64B9